MTALLLTVSSLAALPVGAGLTNLSGGDLDGESLDQGTVLIVVYASWSPRCRDVLPKVKALEKKWGGEARVLLVSFQETAEEVEAFVGSDVEVEIAIDEDGSFSKRHAVTYLPGLLVLREGKTVFSGKLPPRGADQLLTQILS
ncbi:MAG: thioredoxin-like domain-containing protein [Acidobacteriota bacterium]|nr:thioredoxin-like domain-containing protein [Acidobacteriota bacterium]